jgi:cytoskeletal protein CcmA (bactofilin family)
MTVSAFTDSANRLTYSADSSTVAFTFNFEIADEDSIEVYVDNVLKTKAADYSVSFNSGESGTGSIVFTSAPSSSSTIILKRDTNVVRATDFQTSGAFVASAINSELDRITQGLQEADDKIQNRVLRVDHFSGAPTDFTIPSTRANTFLKFDSGGDVTVTDSFEGSTITTTGNATVGGNLSVAGSVSFSSLSVSGNVSGTLTTAAQPNITSLGTLSSLTVDSLTLNDNQIASSTGTIALDDNVTVNGNVTATNLAGTLTTAAQTNITSIGTLSALTVDNIQLNGNTIVSDTGTLAIDDNTTVNGSLTATSLVGTLTTAAQTNITSLGTLTSLQIDGVSINGNDISATRTNDNLTLTPSGTGEVVVNGNISATNIAGTLTTAAQPNITSLGTLTSLQTDNININGNTISTTSGNLTLSNLTSVSIDDINFADNVISATASNADLELEAAGTGQISVSNHRITNLADAVDNKDAVSKGFLNTTLTNAGISPTGQTTFQNTIDNGSSKVEVESVDGDVHITLASSLLYKFESAEFESALPIRLTGDGGFFANKDTVSTSQTVNTGSGVNSAIIGDLTIANGATFTIANNSNLRVI